MPITVYRSGELTPLENIGNENSRKFDEASREWLNMTAARSSSVYAGISLYEVDTVWEDYRSYARGLDSTVYKIVIPDTLMNQDIYAYNIEAYDMFSCYLLRNEETAAAAYLSDYFSTRIHIKDWVDGLLTWPHDETRTYEALIPHHLIHLCEIIEVTDHDRKEWWLAEDVHKSDRSYLSA